MNEFLKKGGGEQGNLGRKGGKDDMDVVDVEICLNLCKNETRKGEGGKEEKNFLLDGERGQRISKLIK